MRLPARSRPVLAVGILSSAFFAGAAIRIVQDQCGPFTDVTPLFCPYVLEAYYTGITAGTSPTTFSPDVPITRGQAAVFVTKGLNQALARSSPRAALGQWWTTQDPTALGLTQLGSGSLPLGVKSDGADLWVGNLSSGTVSRIRGSDGKLLESWTAAPAANQVLVAMGRVFVTAEASASALYMIDPSQPAGDVTTVLTLNAWNPNGIAFDGGRIWTADQNNFVTIITPGSTLPWSYVHSSPVFGTTVGLVYDGVNMWVTDHDAPAIHKLDANGAILQSVPVGTMPDFPAFDGENIWVPNAGSNSVTVLRASTGAVLATLTGNGLNGPYSAAFDGQRILVTNQFGGSVSGWNAAGFAELGSVSTGPGSNPFGVCSDGRNFWITLPGSGALARF